MKKFAACFLAAAMCAVIVACAEEHTHKYETWKYDTAEHWQECECGEKTSPASHEYGSDGVCKKCGSSVFAGEYATVEWVNVQNFADTLSADGKKLDYASGYQFHTKTVAEGYDKRDEVVSEFKEETVWNVQISKDETDVVAHGVGNSARTHDEGLIDTVVRYEAWYRNGYMYMVEQNVLGETVKYKLKADIDGFLAETCSYMELYSDITMIIQLLNGGFYDDVTASYTEDSGYEKYKIDVPSQAYQGVTNKLEFTNVYATGDILYATHSYSEMIWTRPDPVSDGVSGVDRTTVDVFAVPYKGTAETPNDPESFPERAVSE